MFVFPRTPPPFLALLFLLKLLFRSSFVVTLFRMAIVIIVMVTVVIAITVIIICVIVIIAPVIV